MGDILFTLGIMALCLLFEGFFSGSEIGVVSADRVKLRHDAAKGSRGARLALAMLDKPEWLLSTTLVGTTLSVVTNTTMATALMIELFGETGGWFAVLLVTPLNWVFGEIVPKSVFQQRADLYTPRVIFPLKLCAWLFSPLLAVFSVLTRLLARMMGEHRKAPPFTLREEIAMLMQMSTGGGDIHQHEKVMIRRLFDFEETPVRDVMMPLIDVIGIEQGATCGEAMRLAREKAHKRLPVYEERVDRIVGVMNALELLGADPEAPITPYIRPADYVPSSMSIQALLLDMQREHHQIAVVVDEFGGAEGIVTLEDIIEEIVEDIADEYDTKETATQWMRKLGERDYLVSARVDPATLADQLGIDLPRGQYASLAGFLLERVHDVPRVGATIHYKKVAYTIQRGSARVIEEVRVRW
jgi:magnesium and cobalt exporter, CNNM family